MAKAPLAAVANPTAPAPRIVGSVTPLAVPIWPIAGDAPDLETIIADQAATITAQEALLHAYQVDLNAAQAGVAHPAVAGTGTASGSPATQLTLATVAGTIVTGSTVTDAGATTTIPPNTTILGQISGTLGGPGIYLLSQATTASSTALNFTPPPTPSSWPTPTDAPTLMLVQQAQSAILRLQSALLQNYQDLLNKSQTAAPPTGP